MYNIKPDISTGHFLRRRKQICFEKMYLQLILKTIQILVSSQALVII